jgi:hypothetical protein
MVIDHTNPDSVARNIVRTTATLRGLRDNMRRGLENGPISIAPLDVRLVANSDGECWFATGDVQYDTTHGAACEAITLDHNASDAEVADLARELVEGVVDQLAEQTEGA